MSADNSYKPLRFEEQIQHQFGSHAHDYLVSHVHSRGESLLRLVDLIDPTTDWNVLDAASGPGHTGLIFSGSVKQVIMCDLTQAMLILTRDNSGERHYKNIRICQADVEVLPFANETFDLVTCRLAAHHFNNIEGFLAGVKRLLKPGGVLAIVDNIVPDRPQRSKRKRQRSDAGRYINAFERLRDQSHNRCLSLEEWYENILTLELQIIHSETIGKEISFNSWADRSDVKPEDRLRLKAMLLQGPQGVMEHLRPKIKGRNLTFTLVEMFLVCRKAVDYRLT